MFNIYGMVRTAIVGFSCIDHAAVISSLPLSVGIP